MLEGIGVCLTFLGVLGGLGGGLPSFLGGNARDRGRTGCPTPHTMKRKSKHPKNPLARPGIASEEVTARFFVTLCQLYGYH